MAYSGHAFKFQAGGYYFREKTDVRFLIFGLFNPTPGQPGYVYGFLQNPVISESSAFFGQGTINLSGSLRITAGGRYTHDKKSRLGTTIVHSAASDPISFPPDSVNDAAVKYNKFTWRAGLEYDANSRTLLYATVSTGYKAGGFNDGCLATVANCGSPRTADTLFYRPETLTSYEAGFKTRTADGSLRLNGAIFHYDYTNLQISQIVDLGAFTSNAGTAKVDGVELEAALKPSERNTVDLGVNWLNARYTNYAIFAAVAGPPSYPEVQFAGRKLDRSPAWTASAGYTYSMPVGDGSMAIGARTRLSAKYYLLSAVMRAQLAQPSFTKTDLVATYTGAGGRWYVQGYLKNIENKLIVTSFSASPVLGSPAGPGASFQGGQVSLGDPRTFGVRAGFKF